MTRADAHAAAVPGAAPSIATRAGAHVWHASSEQRPVVLMVDDEPRNLLALRAVLEQLDVELVEASSGSEALKVLLRHDVAVVLLDVNMPGMDGFETAMVIKQREASRHVPIVFVTAVSTLPEHRFTGYTVGAVDYIVKPFDPDILRSKVSVFAELWTARRLIEEQAQSLLGAQHRERAREVESVRQAGEERYHLLAEAIPHLLWTTDDSGVPDLANSGARGFLGRAVDRLLAGDWDAIVHPRDVDAFRAGWSTALTRDDAWQHECRLRSSSSAWVWHRVRAVRLHEPAGRGGWVVTASNVDEGVRRQRLLRLTASCGTLLQRGTDVRADLPDVASLLCEDLASLCMVGLTTTGEGGLERVLRTFDDAPGNGGAVTVGTHDAGRQWRQVPLATGFGHVIGSGEPLLVRNVHGAGAHGWTSDDDDLREAVARLDLHSFACAPLRGSDNTHGVLLVARGPDDEPFTREDLVWLSDVGGRIATTLDLAALHDRLVERADAAHALAAIGDAVVLVNEQGRVRLWNRAAGRITGVTGDQASGRTLAEVLPGWIDVETSVPLVDQATSTTSTPRLLPIVIGEREVWIAAIGVTVETGVVYAFRDVTERHAIEKAQADFLATVSHQLKTPLAVIVGAAGTLQHVRETGKEIDEERLITMLVEQSDRLKTIINEVLVASRIDAGRDMGAIGAAESDPVQICRDVVAEAALAAPDNVSVLFEGPDEEAGPLIVNAEYLRQVVSNLVDNAVKYSPQGGVVRVHVYPGRDEWTITVSDEGVGIPGPELERVFEKFHRVRSRDTRGISGTGLGLYICRQFAHAMNAALTAESEVGRGSTFVLTLPGMTAAVASGQLVDEERRPAA